MERVHGHSSLPFVQNVGVSGDVQTETFVIIIVVSALALSCCCCVCLICCALSVHYCCSENSSRPDVARNYQILHDDTHTELEQEFEDISTMNNSSPQVNRDSLIHLRQENENEVHCNDSAEATETSLVSGVENPMDNMTDRFCSIDIKHENYMINELLLEGSGPSIDPCNTTEYLPTWFTQVASLLECTHEGHTYYDDHNDIGLEIPMGAIPLGTSISIDIGVALYGPFQYPEGFRPVSPVFWICIRDQKLSQFLKPFTVTIPHFLNLECPEDISSLGLTFLKAEHEMNSHQMYQFHPADGSMYLEHKKKHGVLQTTHFCSLCIASRDSMDAIKKANFCISAVVPHKIAVDQSAHAYFFLTFLLETCLTTLKDQISAILERESGFQERRQDFQFRDDDDQALAILLPDSIEDIWSFGLQFRHKVHSHTCM